MDLFWYVGAIGLIAAYGIGKSFGFLGRRERVEVETHLEDIGRVYSPPIVYHQNLIDALNSLKIGGPQNANLWATKTDAKIVAEAYEKGCISSSDTGPMLTERGRVVSRMVISYEDRRPFWALQSRPLRVVDIRPASRWEKK